MTVKTPNAAKPDPRRRLPAVGALCEDPIARPLKARYGAAALTRAVRAVLSEARTRLAADPDAAPTTGALLEAVEARLADGVRETLFPVINATGVVIHTNLGRAPLPPEAVAAAALAAGYANLELDLVTGRRSSRQEHLDPLIAEMTGAEGGLAVNNCAGAVLLGLAALAEGAPVIVSRGELVEIGGGFRVPDVVAQSGSRLIEVGTTNRTHLRDYEMALADHPDARVILRTHPSNFRISGFTSAPSLESLAHFAHAHGLLLLEDLGGGALVDLAPFGLADEPTVQDSLAAGVDLVLFSGDKLLGGPQAGLAAGRRALVERLEAHPLARALRLDKLSTAALAATLRLYRPPCDPFEQIPILRLLAQDTTTLDARAIALKSQVGGFENLEIEIMETEGYAGGGALPMRPLPGRALALRSLRLSAEALAHQLRTSATPILGRIEQDRVLLEMRTLADEDLPVLASAIAAISQIPLGPEA
ncbi:MAG: L-seryl-tRNA(Sec) selenium transferase [Phenylobacterium sp.]|uniref:L-seryl-tRNA(Sec) selenium transferase n=1 Tax=Phenylobacterium sp. TaxID=1871053 RepID=UPI0025CFF8A2|nr:L-seryl-tRNA(Sec) selenium transferase [Phenylobacterium sp.]MCA3757289.1 L-seryl-tRNA(Sec) selenium transferase [Phenylobacterium sp.]